MFKKYFSDILYSLKLNDRDAYFYCVVEPQKKPQKELPFRLLRYSIAVMKQHLDQGHTSLPLVLPIVFYQGEQQPYPFSMRLLDSFDDPELAHRFLMEPYPLVNGDLVKLGETTLKFVG